MDLKTATLIAIDAHDGQLDKGGKPYIEHVIRVMADQWSEDGKIVAMLHDVLEDSNICTLEDLTNLGFSNEVVFAVDCLTKKENENYETYIKKIKFNPLAACVKIADLRDNMNLSRLKEITDKDIARCKKYQEAIEDLIGVI
jgi:(p)ppGpp synthase/HD superfamily hydrolase